MPAKKFLHKKSLGQHFLTSPHYLAAIADAANISAGERVLEVGPGEGALTALLLARGAQVTAVEKDSRLIPILEEKFAKEISEKKFVLLEADIMEFDISNRFAKNKKYKVVANIPYYITGALLKKFLSEKRPPGLLVLLVQKEVAERITRHGPINKKEKESILSLSVKAYGAPSYLKTVPRGAFSPPPAVDSAILKIAGVSRRHFTSVAHEKRFFALVRAGFAHKRKFLARNLEKILGKTSSERLRRAGIADGARAEDVPLEVWLKLARG